VHSKFCHRLAQTTNLARRILFFAFAFPFATSRPCVIWQQLSLKCEAQIWLVGAGCHLETAVSDVKEARIWLVGVGCHLEIAVSDVKSADLIGFSLKSHYIVIRETYRRHSSFVITQTSATRQKSKKRNERLSVLLLVLVLQDLTIVDETQKTNTNRGHKTWHLSNAYQRTINAWAGNTRKQRRAQWRPSTLVRRSVLNFWNDLYI